MHFRYELCEHWPALAWRATLTPGDDTVVVQHGRWVETSGEWFGEIVWPGAFGDGDFDQTEHVFGSGGRLRDGGLTFVPSCTVVDRLVGVSTADKSIVSNSLPCVLAAIDASLDPTRFSFQRQIGSILRGIDDYDRELPTSAGPVRLLYYHNLRWDGRSLNEIAKPSTLKPWNGYQDYFDFMSSTLKGMAANGADASRRHPFGLIGTMSSGYDSAAISALAVPAGLKQVLSFSHSDKGDPDSGAPVAEALGLELLLIDHEAYRKKDRPEAEFVAADAKGEDVYFAGAEQHLVGKLLLTGHTGDRNWELHLEDFERGPRLQRVSRSGLSLAEYRLRVGFIHCCVPFLGALRTERIVEIGRSEEMKAWDTGGDYTRPIPRRILEDAGCQRGTFATSKKMASILLAERKDVLSESTTRDYHRWLRQHAARFYRIGRLPPLTAERCGAPVKWLARRAWFVHRFAHRLPAPLGFVARWSRSAGQWSAKRRLNYYLFPWAVENAKQAYVE